jgi:predicted GNAT superfamily acetyltransferase
MAAVLALNTAEQEATAPLTAARLEALVAAASFARAVPDAAGGAAAFLLGFAPGDAYDSPNFLWFRARMDRFAYVDRVAVAAAARRRGLGRALYAEFAAFAAARGLGPLVCEVNLDPPNPVSDAFHARLGFAEVGRALAYNGRVVRYLAQGAAAPLIPASPPR